MGSDASFVDFVIEQIRDVGEITAKKMFGEYGIYSDGKIFGLICNNTLYIKPTDKGRAFIGDPVEAPPYEGAQKYFLVGAMLEDSVSLSRLVYLTVEELPEPKPKRIT